MSHPDRDGIDVYYEQIRLREQNLTLVMTREGALEGVGPSTEWLLGFQNTELHGRPMEALVHKERLPEMMEAVQTVWEDNDQESLDLQFWTKEGRMKWFRCTLFRVDDGSGHKVCLQGIDITEWKDSESELELMNKKLSILGSATRHDVLNSLTGLFGYLELAEGKTKDETLLKYVRKAKASAEAIRKQMDFTRTYQEIGAKKPDWINVANAVRSAYSALSDPRIPLDLDVGELTVYADPMLEKVFYNLLDNTFRHGERATYIKVRFGQTDGAGQLYIEDDGVGIAADEKELIFRRGYGKNTGLGLYVSREVLGITGIGITENGELGKGTRLVITIPPGIFRLEGH
jgi:PAS domain S-box-containing protein